MKILIKILFCLLIFPALCFGDAGFIDEIAGSTVAGGGSITHVRTVDTATDDEATSLTFSVESSGTDRFIAVLVGIYDSDETLVDDITGVTYNSVAMSRKNLVVSSDDDYEFAIYYTSSEPAATTANVVVSFGLTAQAVLGVAVVYNGVNTSSPVGDDTFSGTGYSTTHTDDITTTSNNEKVIFGCVATGDLSNSHTQRGTSAIFGKYLEGCDASGNGGDVTMTMTTGDNSGAAHGGMAIKPAS